TEYNSDFLPDPQTGDDKAIGHGTHCALAAALAAPEAELTLVRIDPVSLVQLQFLAKVVNGDIPMDDNIGRRAAELQATATGLSNRHAELARERVAILNNYEDETDIRREYEILGPEVRGWLFSSREWHLRRVAELDRDRRQYWQSSQRFQRLFGALQKLRGVRLVRTSLVRNDR